MDARVSFNAARVRARHIPLRGLAMDISLDNGLLRIDPMVLRLTRGRISGAASINAREETPIASLDVRIADARLESVIVMQNGEPLTGVLQGRARLTGRGASVRDAAANADGEVTLVIPSGEVREAFAELTGINVARGLGLLLSGDQRKVDIRCGVASFRIRNGVARAQNFVIDTENVLIRGGGGVNLRNETLDLRLEGEAKEPRLLSVAAPVTVQGRLRAPQVGVDAEDALGQGGLAALLASVAAPLAAVLPFVDPGLAEDANCAALLAGRESARL
jgi:AsmA family protein